MAKPLKIRLPSKKVLITISIISVMLMLMPVLAGFFINEQKIAADVVQAIENGTGRKTVARGMTSFKFFPYPSVVIKQLYVENSREGISNYLFKADKLIVEMGFGGLFKGVQGVTVIKLQNAELKLEKFRGNVYNTQGKTLDWALRGFSENWIDKRKVNISVQNLLISHLNVDSKNSTDTLFPALDMSFGGGAASLNGKAVRDNQEYSFVVALQNDVKDTGGLTASITSAKYNADFKGKLNLSTLAVAGKLAADVVTTAPAKVSLTADASFRDMALAVDNITFDADSAKGKADFKYNINQNESSLAVKLDRISLTAFYDYIKKEYSGLESNQDSRLLLGNVFGGVPLSLNIEAKEAIVEGGGTVSFTVDIENRDTEITINQINFVLPGDTRITTFGFITKPDDPGARFEGNIEVSSASFAEVLKFLRVEHKTRDANLLKEFSMNGNISLGRNELRLTEMRMKLDDITAVGVTDMKLGIPLKVDARLKINKVNLDSYGVFAGEDVKPTHVDANQRVELVYSGPFAWLKNVNYELNGVFSISDLSVNGNAYKDSFFDGVLSRNSINLKELDTTYGDSKARGKLKVELVDGWPEFNADLTFSKFDFDHWFPWDDATAQNSSPTKLDSPGKWSLEKIIFKSLREIRGDFKFSSPQFKFRDFSLAGVIATGRISTDELILESFSGRVFDGMAQMTGSIYTGAIPGFSLSFVLSNCEVNDLFMHFMELDTISGRIGASGNIKTSGTNEASWVSNLNGKLSLVSNALKIQGFDLPNFGRRLANIKTVADVVNLSKLSFGDGETLFDKTEVELDFQNGIAIPRKAVADAGYLRASFLGKLDFPEWKIDGTAYFNLKIPDAENMPSIGMIMSGAIDSPAKTYDTKAIEAYIAKKSTESIIRNEQ